MEQLPVNLQSQHLSSLESSVAEVTTASEGSNIPGESTVPEDSNVTENSSVPSIETSNHADIQCPMGPPANGEVPDVADVASPSTEPTESVTKCSYCSDTFEKAQQLQAHVLATHTQTRKRRRSSDNQSLVRKTTQEIPTSPIAKITKKQTIESKERVVLESSSQLDSTAQQESRTSATSNDSSPVQQVPEKAYISCYICGRSFDLKIKLNRHLKQHKG